MERKGETIIIDPGCYFTAEQETLQQFIENNDLKPVQLVNTHCHLDHVLVTNGWQKWGLELFIHPDEEKCCNWRRQVVQCGFCLSTIIMVPCIF